MATFIAIKSYHELPNAPHAMFKTEEQMNKECKKFLNRIPDTVYVHRTGLLVPMTAAEFQANKVSLAIWCPEDRT